MQPGLCRSAILAALVLMLAGAVVMPAPAEEEDRLARLEEKVATLEQQVRDLRVLMPSFTNIMPNFSERFHVMHRAGDAGDWAVAQHELLELRRIIEMTRVIDREKSRLMQNFMTAPLDQIAAAIEHQDESRFLQALDATVTNCNACHDAAGSPFINVVLNARRAVSMRHAHEFLDTEPMTEHTHEH